MNIIIYPTRIIRQNKRNSCCFCYCRNNNIKNQIPKRSVVMNRILPFFVYLFILLQDDRNYGGSSYLVHGFQFYTSFPSTTKKSIAAGSIRNDCWGVGDGGTCFMKTTTIRRRISSSSHRKNTHNFLITQRKMSNDDSNNNNEESNSMNKKKEESANSSRTNFLDRFVAPVLDDPYLPLSDAVTAQIIAPVVQIGWLILNHAPRPSWCQPFFQTDTLYGNGRGAFIAPVLIHGAALASCWLFGALAAQCYERCNISPKKIIIDTTTGQERIIVPKNTQTTTNNKNTNGGSYDNRNEIFDTSIPAVRWEYDQVFTSVIKAGAFASGLLILGTQFDLFLEYKGHWVQLGESEEIDFRLLVAYIELMNDIVFEAITIVAWRLYLAYQTQKQGT